MALNSTPLILASTSPYRRELMDRLGFNYRAQAPRFDEDAWKGKIADPVELAQTLARGKAESLADGTNCVVGGDQLVALGSEIFGKGGNEAGAVAQLQKMQGKTHELITAVCVIFKKEKIEFVDRTRITLRSLSEKEIRDYVRRDKPFDCAGSYKIENAGVTLIEKLECVDPSAIQGLPLIKLSQVLRERNF